MSSYALYPSLQDRGVLITGGAGLAFTSMTARDSAEAGSVAAT